MEKLIDPRLRWVERVSYLMDEQFRVPGTKFRFGLDPILNLIPIAGDLGGFAISAVMLLTIAKHGISRKVLILMTLNILIDTAIGAIPILGNIFDFAFKSNNRNIRLLKEHYQEGKHQGSGRGLVTWIIVVLVSCVLIFVYLIWLTVALLHDVIV